MASATNANRGGVVTPRQKLAHYRDDLQSLRASSDFPRVSDVQKSDVWACTGQIADLLGDTALVT